MRPPLLPALSCGYLAAERSAQSLSVHSSFAHALNLRDAQGALFTLLCGQRYPDLPDALRVALPVGWEWRHMAVRHAPVRLVAGRLLAERFEIDLRHAPVWRPTARSATRPLTAAAFTTHYPRLCAQLQQYGLAHACVSDLAWQPLTRSGALIPQETPERLERQVPCLIGYGKGLTPDGDDYLLGYLAALTWWPLSPTLAAHRERLRGIIQAHLTLTTDISAHYLSRALQGHFSQPIYHLLSQLSTNTAPAALHAAAERVMRFGATSGVDCLAGLLHGMRTLNAVQ
ncbi:DUF2877 domain-containing protein [Edwardsiella tarda]|uniref:DUF2877 domain-containing protein n=1 Tax=Edwardsiella tarda TaxID=636 RepID=UPI00351BFE29